MMDKKAVKTSIPALMTGVALSFVTGCANHIGQDKVMDLELVKQKIEVNKTTLSEVRGFLGAPGLISHTVENGTKVAGYSFNTNVGAGRIAGNMLIAMATFGIKNTDVPMVGKYLYLTLGPDDVVTEMKTLGYSWVHRHYTVAGISGNAWNEAERKLTEEELRLPIRYGVDEIYEKYWQGLAAKKGVPVSALSDDDKYQRFNSCNVDCHMHSGAKELYGEFEQESFNTVPKEQPGDKSIFAE